MDHDEGGCCDHHSHLPFPSMSKQGRIEQNLNELQEQKEQIMKNSEALEGFEVLEWTDIYKKCALYEDIDEVEGEMAEKEELLRKMNESEYSSTQGHDHSAEREIFEMDLVSQFGRMVKLVGEGRELFGEGQFELADQSFHQVSSLFFLS